MPPSSPGRAPAIGEQLQGVTGPDRHGWCTAFCPFHADRKHPNLRFNDSGFRCFACGAKGSIADLARRLGQPAPPSSFTARIETAYDYQGEDGQLLFQVMRLRDPKDFRQRRPNGTGGWHWNLHGVTPVLYRLPELLRADPAEPVFVAEGEKDVDRLRALGLVATTNPGGAGKWRVEYNQYLRGRRVVVLPDNDAVGQDHAQDVRRWLNQ